MVLMEGFGALWCFLVLVTSWKPDPKYLRAEEWEGKIQDEEKKKFAIWSRNSVIS